MSEVFPCRVSTHTGSQITHDISDICMADLFSKVGAKISATARFSTVGGESGSADTARDPRGFSVKLRTEGGNWDHVYVRTLPLSQSS